VATPPAVPDAQRFEKLGVFYLGRRFDLETDAIADDLVLYDAKDLTTHAVCVGMTGSGKTGLCVALLEEAALDGIPALVIDPKGDLGNLALLFPGLAPSDFRPWVDEAEAARKGVTPDAYAESVAKAWREGLASWGQGPERIEQLLAAAEVAIYTPGSASGGRSPCSDRSARRRPRCGRTTTRCANG
jgi:DNA helicase HerA-like ATPase